MPTDTPSYLSGFGQVLIFLAGGLLFVMVALLISKLIRPHRPGPEKLTAYESGEQAVGAAWIQFNLRYFVMAIVFLLFEVEIVFLFPWATVFANPQLQEQTQGAWGWFSLIEIVLFIGVLALGLAYIWAHGYLEWLKPTVTHPPYPSPVPRKYYDAINERYRKK